MAGWIIAIDGTAGSGKSTVGRRLARRFKLKYIDSGALYRAVGLSALKSGADLNDTDRLTAIAKSIRIELSENDECLSVLLDGKDVTREIRSPEVSFASSKVGVVQGVRQAINIRLREMGAGGNALVEGRDIGTVVFPDATIKIFLDASLEVRARRRQLDQAQDGIEEKLQSVKEELDRRDRRDISRLADPLAIASDAVIIDTSDKTLDEVEEEISEIIARKISRN